MSAKNTVTADTGGNVTKLSGSESEEYLQRVAANLKHKMNELSELKGWNRMTAEMKNTLLALNIADDYFKARNQAEVFDEDLQNKDKELYELKQQIVELQMELDELTSPDTPAPSNDRYRSSRKH